MSFIKKSRVEIKNKEVTEHLLYCTKCDYIEVAKDDKIKEKECPKCNEKMVLKSITNKDQL